MTLNSIQNSNLYSAQKTQFAASPAPAVEKQQQTENNLNEIPAQRHDTVTLSKEGLEAHQQSKEDTKSSEDKKNLKEDAEKMKRELEQRKEELEKAREQAESDAEAWKTVRKCLSIALQMMMGNKVPVTDEKFLMKNDGKLYGKAISLRSNMESIRDNNNSKECQSVLEEEDIKALRGNQNQIDGKMLNVPTVSTSSDDN